MANTTQGLKGLTFGAAISPNPGIPNRLNQLKETGDPRFGVYENEPVRRFRQTLRDIDEDGELLSQMVGWRPSRNQRMQGQRLGFLGSDASEDIGLEAAEAGFGESRFDRRLTSPAQLEDLEDARARQQSTLGVFGNSFAKMGILAATTAADSWVGLPAGLINLISEAFSGNVDSGSEGWNAFISNPVSSYLQGINEKSEEIFRNYQTSEERNRPWWENMFTANFIGDTLIKNAGFTIGAVVGGKAAVNVLGKVSGAKEARDAFKGLAIELGLEGKSASEVVEMLAKGATTLEKEAAVKALAESAKRLKNAELGLQIAGGLLAGTGEARIEALNGVSELEKNYEELYGDLDLERAKALNHVRESLLAGGIDPDSPEGQVYYDEQRALIDENYLELQEKIAHDKAMVANTIFALNVPLLTAGDMIQWGKLMLGGYALDRNLVKGIKKAAETTTLREVARTPADLVRTTRYAAKGSKFTDFLGKVGAGSRNVLVEMQEEMNQSFFSETAKAKAMGSTTELLEALYDPMAIADTVSWLDAAKEGMRQSWLNKDDWVEGFAGGFMGFLGLPSISVKVNESGKRKPKITMEGGIWSPIREKTELHERRDKLVETLNNRLASKDFLNYYYGKIGNAHFDSIKENAVKQGDENLYKKADHAQLINDAMMFERAGRLQDFIDIIDSFGNVSDSTIDEIKKLFSGSDEIQKMTTSGMRTLINDNVEKAKRQLDSYMKIADNIRTVYGNTMPDNQIAEMTWQTAHLDEIEYDLQTILSHPETSAMLSSYRAANPDSTEKLTDYDIIGSPAYSTWLRNKYKDKKDTTNKSELETAIKDAADASYDMKERSQYIDNISALSSDPELIQKRMLRLKKQQEELKRLARSIKAIKALSTTDKLSEFISAMEDLGDSVPESTLADIKKEADRGNETAKEYLMVRDIDNSIESQIKKLAEKVGVGEEEIKQAMAAWNYFKHNSDTAYELTSKHNAGEVAPEVAGEKAISLLNDAIEASVKSLKIFDKIQKRTIKKKTESKPESTEGNTKFNTTGNKLTKKKFEEICEDLQKNSHTGHDILGGANIIKIDLDKGDVYFDGVPAQGIIYLYYKGANIQSKGKYALPIAYDINGNEIDPDDVRKLTNEDGVGLTEYLIGDNYPAGGFVRYPVDNASFANKVAQKLPIGKKKAEPAKPGTKKKEGKDAGKKTSPHKFIAPNMDMALLGSDGQAVAEVLKGLSEDAEVHFGMESEDGPIYILAGDSNMKIGTLPEEVEGSDSYSGLAELKELIKKEYSESKSRTNADGMWISEKYVNHIREKQESGFVTTSDNIPINDIPGFDGIKEPILMFAYNDRDGQKYLFSTDSVDIDQVQFRAGGGNQIKSGFAYLLVPSGKGRYIPVMLYTQNVNADTFDLHDPSVTTTGFGKRLSDTIDKVVAAVTNSNEKEKIRLFKLWGLSTRTESDPNSLQNLLYFRAKGKSQVQFFIKETCKGHDGWFANDDVVMVINTHFEDSEEDDPIMIVKGKTDKEGNEISIRDQVIDTLNQLEFETESGEVHKGPIAQIDAAHFEEDPKDLSERIRELVDARMLLTDVKDFDLSMPSYILDYWSVAQGKFLRPSHPSITIGAGARVTTKKTKGKGTEKIAEMEIGGTEIKYNLSSNQVKIGAGKWFTPLTSTKAIDAEIKKLGFKDIKTFVRTARALAIIADKYGDSITGDGRIGNRVLLKDFTSGKDEGFVLTDNGGRFMTASELVAFKTELKSNKSKKRTNTKSEEAKRVQKAKEEIENESDNEDEFMQDIDENSRANSAEIKRIESVHTVRDAIEHLKKYAPQYSEFLNYISGIGFYDDVLVQLAETVGKSSHGGKTVGTNKFKFNEKASVFTNSIVIGRQSFGYQTLMHELVHAFTVVALRYDSAMYEDVKTQMNYLQDSIGKSRLARELGSYAASYAFRNPYEFIAEFFSNPKLQKLAKEVTVPEETESKKTSVFARIINFIADKLRSLFGKHSDSFYKNLKEKLFSVVDRQVQLQETGKIIFKTNAEFEKAKRVAAGASVDGVMSSTKIPTVEESYDYRHEEIPSFDAALSSSEVSAGVERFLTVSQLVNENDEFSSLASMTRLISSRDLFEYNSGGNSSLLGVRDLQSGVFVVTRAYPFGMDDYSSLLNTAVKSEVPILLGVHPDEVHFYAAIGFHPVHSSEVEGKIFMANPVFTDANLFSLGTMYRPFANVLDNNAGFVALRRSVYSDQEWNKFSEMERYHARKCIGI